MKRVFTLILALMLLSCALCGCESEADKIAALSGRWETVSYFDSESVLEMLQDIDLYEEEIALLDPGAMILKNVVEFRDDKSYTITCDADETIACVEQYFYDIFSTFYENRTQLNDCYEEDLTSMSVEEFYAFYAQLYGQDDIDTLVSLLVYNAVDEEFLLEDTETGTYRIKGSKIYFQPIGSTVEEYVDYSIDGDELTLVFTDMTVVYTKD